jgi:hypothetical protein
LISNSNYAVVANQSILQAQQRLFFILLGVIYFDRLIFETLVAAHLYTIISERLSTFALIAYGG